MKDITIEVIKILKVPLILLTMYGLFSLSDLKNGIAEIILTLKNSGVKELTLKDIATIKMTDNVIENIEKKLPQEELKKIKNDIDKLKEINQDSKKKIIKEANNLKEIGSLKETQKKEYDEILNEISNLSQSKSLKEAGRLNGIREKENQFLSAMIKPKEDIKYEECYGNIYSEEEIKNIFGYSVKELKLNNYYELKKGIQVVKGCREQSSIKDVTFNINKNINVKIKEISKSYDEDSFLVKLYIDKRDI